MSEPTEDVAADQDGEDGEQKPKKRKLIPIIAIVAGLGGGAVLGLTLIGPPIGAKMAEGAALPEPGDHDGGGGDDGHGGEGGAEGDALSIIDNLVVNPSDTEGTRFLLASIALEPSSVDLNEVIAARDIELRDALLRVLGSKTVDQLVDISQRADLAEELKNAVESIVGEGTIHRIFIPQYVIQ